MLRGRKPKPKALKLLAGNPGKRKPNDRQPEPAAEIPSPPEILDDIALIEWHRITQQLHCVGCVTQLDRAALAAYCIAYSRWATAEISLRDHGLIVKSPAGFPMQNPFLSIANRAIDQMTRLAAEFGMTPSARTRIQTQPPEADDPLSKLLAQQKGTA